MRVCLTVGILLVLLAPGPGVSAASPPPPPTVIAGTIASIGADSMTLTTKAGTKQVRLTSATGVQNWIPATLADITPGALVGITARKEMNGSLTAVEIHLFPPNSQVLARQFPWADDTLMTNAPVTAFVNTVSGRKILVRADERDVTVAVPPSTDIRRATVSTREELRTGRRVIALGRANDDGSLTAGAVIVYPGR